LPFTHEPVHRRRPEGRPVTGWQSVNTCADLDWSRPLLDAGPGVVAILRVLRNDLPDELPVRFVDELLA
ncbi:hypothetical protein, partial [Nocardia cyriacigeorgica]|uniref:hypothetical protein n=1 Tax=Nocardia cyriacigeorgica TaxID=135487 RepID=UPI002453AA93